MTNIDIQFQQAYNLYKQGNYHAAGSICAGILQTTPTHSQSLLLTSMILNKIKKYDAALQYIERSFQIHKATHAIYVEKGIAQMGLHQLAEAEKCFETAIKINANYEKAHIQLAKCKKLKKEQKQAEEILIDWLKIKPQSISALNNLANLYTEQNRYDKAEKYYNLLLNITPNNVKALVNIGYFHMLQRDFDLAENFMLKSLKIDNNNSYALSKYAILTAQKGDTDKALNILDKAYKKAPSDYELINTYGNIFIQLGEFKKAKNAYLESLKIDQNNVQTLNALASVYSELSNFTKAAEIFEKAVELNPWNNSTKLDLANTYQFIGKHEEAYNILRGLYEKWNDDENVIFSLTRVQSDLCEWDNRDEIEQKYISKIEQIVQKGKAYPFRIFNFNYYDIPVQLHFEASILLSKYFSKQVESIKKRLQFNYNWPKHKRIRIGYISPDFREHPIGQVVYQMFQYHNRNEFEVYAYALLHQPKVDDIYRDTIKDGVDHFIDIQHMGFEQAAKKINADEIDILIDLAGYTTYSRSQILALKPAPVQILFMGQPDSSGADFIDYYIADKTLIPEENKKYYSEEIIYLPTGYFGSPLEISDKKYTKSDFGIPDKAFVFCCFCNPYKYEPSMFAAWMNILKQCPNSVLWLNPAKNSLYKKNILKYAAQHGVDSSRIFFAQRLSHPDYMARYKVCDLFLDTLHYSAGSTAISALMANVPVLTTTGNTNAENMGAAICRAANLHETICRNANEYIEKAIEFANKRDKLDTLKTKLAAEKNRSLLFNVKQFVSEIELNLKKVYKRTT